MNDRQMKTRVRAARYTPSPCYEEELNMTLKKLPQKRRKTMPEKILRSVSIAAVALLLVAVFAPPIVRAAGPLIERLFGQVVEEFEQEQTRSHEEKLETQIADSENAYRAHAVENAEAVVGGVMVSVASISLTPEAYHDQSNAKGDISVTLAYSEKPAFDPCWVDYTLAVDGKELPMAIDEQLAYFRENGGQTLSEEQWDVWNHGGIQGNSTAQSGEYLTYLSFEVDDWRWDDQKQLTLSATIDGERLSIPFAYEPEKAHEEAVRMAEISVALGADNYAHEKDELEAMRENAVSLSLTGSAYDTEYAISELSYANGKLYFTAAFSGMTETNPKLVGLSYWIENISVDGMNAAVIGSDNDTYENGQYTAIYQAALGRDPKNLPEESLIKLDLTLGDYENRTSLAFRYNWTEKKATPPENETEMAEWVKEAEALEKRYAKQYAEDIYYDLTGLNLRQIEDGVTMSITGINYRHDVSRIELFVSLEGDVDSSGYHWHFWPEVTINDLPAFDDGGGLDAEDHWTQFFVKPPMHISEFGAGTKVSLTFPLIRKDRDLEEEKTNYHEPDDVLKFDFTIDESMRPTKNPEME